MNLTTLTTRVRRSLAEAGSGLNNDTQIQSEINRSARTLASELGLFKKQGNVDVVAGVATVPADLLSIIAVTDGARRTNLYPVDATMMNSDALPYTGGPAESYSFDEAWGRTLNIYPPTASLTATLIYRSAPPAMVAGTDEAWGGAYSDYHDLIALHAAHQLYGGRGASAARDPVWLQRYAQRLDEFKGTLALKALSNPGMTLRPGPRRRTRW